MSGAVAIFVKTIGHSVVKSRLAAECGAGFAQEFHSLAAAAVASVALRAQAMHGLSPYWAVAEPEALSQWHGMPVIAQVPGGLGERMAQVQAQLVAHHGLGLLVGADSPQLSVALLEQARRWLDAAPARLALGPAHDGGFWLFGANLAPAPELWNAVPYSVPDTARALRECMGGLGQWSTLPTLTDADHASDLPEVLRALQALPDATEEQRALAGWLRRNGLIPADAGACAGDGPSARSSAGADNGGLPAHGPSIL
jgi:hypothetical protein